MEQQQAKAIIWKVATEAHPHYVYQLTNGVCPFQAKDIITTSESDPVPDAAIFIVNEVFAGGIMDVHRQIPDAVNKIVRKLGTVDQIIPQEQRTAAEVREAEVRDMFHKLFIETPWKGTIEERLLDGYLYTLTSEDMTLPREDRVAVRLPNQRQVMVQTGKAGVMTYVEAGRKRNLPDAEISKSIWIQMKVEGVLVYVNIKNLKVNNEESEGSNSDNSGGESSS